MGLRFCFGGSGAGKSKILRDEMICRSMKETDRQFLFIVPDQFTMQTQKDLVLAHPNHGIMNIDVLSFGRLSYRILEEVGKDDRPVLDDTGKNLILRQVAGLKAEELKVLQAYIHKQGYIHEIKSAISEFMQYGITPEQMPELIEYAKDRGTLEKKLQDLNVLYQGFLTYIDGKYLTTEETMDRLATAIPKSKILKDSMIVFDGFTGFTPIQNKVISQLLLCAKEVTVSVVMDGRENPFIREGEQRLFDLSKKTVASLERIASEAGVTRDKDIVLQEENNIRFSPQGELSHLEKNLFRFPCKSYEKQAGEIKCIQALSPKHEVIFTARKIRELVREKGLLYRDIAVVTGDLSTYGSYAKSIFQDLEIPCFIDETREISLNPFVEFIRSSLLMIKSDFSYESVFHYLRSGLSGFETEEIDLLEIYVKAMGVRGKKRWQTEFRRIPDSLSVKKDHNSAIGEESKKNVECLAHLNELRAKLADQIMPLLQLNTSGEQTVRSAREKVRVLYDFIVANDVQSKLLNYEKLFEVKGDLSKAKEYAQIYRYIMDLLSQISELLGDEEVSLSDFCDLLDAGFSEIEVGIIPQNVDRVVVGDIERTRLNEVKVLFFLGINDGNIPKRGGKGGIISDIDREFLTESGMEFSPSPRQQMYIQRLYLYMNMTKPSEMLYLSYAKTGNDGKALRPAYLIDTLKKLFPKLEVTDIEAIPELNCIETKKDGMSYLANCLRELAAGRLSSDTTQNDEKQNKMDYVNLYRGEGFLEQLLDAAFIQYEDNTLGKALASKLYGSMLVNSVSRLEQFASCAYAHFLRYGMKLGETEEFSLESSDLGTLFHNTLAVFSKKVEESKYSWMNYPKEEGRRMLSEAVEEVTASYGNGILFENSTNEYVISGLERVLTRTTDTLQYQLQKGRFQPVQFEMNFQELTDLDSVSILLGEEEKMRLVGRIDRLDEMQWNDKWYVKIIDYKSGNKKFNLAAMYYGLQLQLVVYMNAAIDYEKKEHPGKEIVPAGLFYYHVADPFLEDAEGKTPEEINAQLLSALRMNGLVNSKDEVIDMLDTDFQKASDVIPVEKKTDGSLGARSSVMDQENLNLMSEYVNRKIQAIGKDIISGKKSLDPYEMGTEEACTYCSFKGICGFDEQIKGCKKRELIRLSEEEVLDQIKETIQVQTENNNESQGDIQVQIENDNQQSKEVM